MNSILIVDGDLGFVVWLGRALYEAGYQSLPATSGADAIARMDQFEAAIALLIVSPSVPDLSQLIRRMSLTHRQFPIIVATEIAETPKPLPLDLRPSVFFPKPSVPNEKSKQDWLELIHHVFAEETSSTFERRPQ